MHKTISPVSQDISREQLLSNYDDIVFKYNALVKDYYALIKKVDGILKDVVAHKNTPLPDPVVYYYHYAMMKTMEKMYPELFHKEYMKQLDYVIRNPDECIKEWQDKLRKLPGIKFNPPPEVQT